MILPARLSGLLRRSPLALACRLARRNTGRHVADSLAGADWLPPTPLPDLAPLPPSPPRVIPAMRDAGWYVRKYYDDIEWQMVYRLREIRSRSYAKVTVSYG